MEGIVKKNRGTSNVGKIKEESCDRSFGTSDIVKAHKWLATKALRETRSAGGGGASPCMQTSSYTAAGGTDFIADECFIGTRYARAMFKRTTLGRAQVSWESQF